MRIGLLADIHGNHVAFEAALIFLKSRVDRILFAGDLVGYYPFVKECLELWDDDLMIGVRGNHDQVLLDCVSENKSPSSEYSSRYGNSLERCLQTLSARDVERISKMKISLEISFQDVLFSVFHGSPWDILEGRVYPDFKDWHLFESVKSDIVLLGQTHHPMECSWKNKRIINPGSIGQPRNRIGAFACCAEIDLASSVVTQHQVPYDPAVVIQDARKANPDMPYLVEVFK